MTKQSPRIWYKGPTALDMLGLEPPNIFGGSFTTGGTVELPLALQSGLFVWFDADDSSTVATTSTSSGLRVASITDNASGITLYSNGTAKPHYASTKINGRNGIVFNAYSRQVLENRELLALDLTGPTTIVAAVTSYSTKNNEGGSNRNIPVQVHESGISLELIAGLWHPNFDGTIGAVGAGRWGGGAQSALSTNRFNYGSPNFITYVERQTSRSVLLNNAGSGLNTSNIGTTVFERADSIVFGGGAINAEGADWHGLVHEWFLWNKELSQDELDELHEYLEEKYYGTISYPGPEELADISGLGLWLKPDTDYMDFGVGGGEPLSGGSVNLYSWRDAAGIFPEAIFTQTQSGVATYYTDTFDWAEEQGATHESFTEAVGQGVVFNAIGGLKMNGPEFPPVARWPYTIFVRYVHGEGAIYSNGRLDVGGRWNGTLATNSVGANAFRPVDQYNSTSIIHTLADVAENAGDGTIDQTTHNVLVIRRKAYNEYTYQSFRVTTDSEEAAVTDNRGNALSMTKLTQNRTHIGAIPSSAGNLFNGILYEYMMYYGDLTDDQVNRVLTYIRGFASDSSFIPVRAGLISYNIAGSGVTVDVNGGVSRVEDYSQSSIAPNLFIQNTDNLRPTINSGSINGQDTILFDGSNTQWIWDPLSSSAPVEGFSVISLVKPSGSAGGTIWSIEREESGGLFNFYELTMTPANSGTVSFNSAEVGVGDSAATIPSGWQPDTWTVVVGISVSDSERKVRTNSTTYDIDTGTISVGQPVPRTNIGRLGYNDTNHFTGEMAETAIYNRAISDIEVDALIDYWNTKYGLSL